MKKYLLSSLLVATTLVIASCDRAGNITPNISQVAASGTWRVSLFTSNGMDEAANFTGYSFTFNSDGTLSVIKSGITKEGTWGTSTGAGKFNINLGPKDNTNKPLGELTYDWKIISVSETEIRLKDDNTGQNEFLTFTKN